MIHSYIKKAHNTAFLNSSNISSHAEINHLLSQKKSRKLMLTGFFRYNKYYCSSLTYGNNAI